MRSFFLLYLVTFSFTPFLRDFFAVFCLLCLLPYYFLDYQNSTLKLFDGKKYFVLYYIFLVLGITFSQNIAGSFKIVLLHSFTSLTLPFVAMECVRNIRELKHVLWALILALFVQGCNGVYQYFTGYDFILHTAINSGRLTGSFSDYRVGNYIALTLIPASAIFLTLRQTQKIKSFIYTSLLLSPAVFLMFFSYTRNAYITLVVAMFLGAVIWRVLPWKVLIALGVGGIGLLQLPSIRLSWSVIQSDNRWTLWEYAWELFKENPIFGAGLGMYQSAVIDMLKLAGNSSHQILSHPHNIYLQFLCENGLVGFLLVMAFLLGILCWSYKKLRMLIVQYKSVKITNFATQDNLYWRIAVFFWCGWGAFLASGIVGHNFFQRWWQALVMAYLGVLIGIITRATQKNTE